MSMPTRVAVIVEDDDDIRVLIETTLRQAGFEVYAAGNGGDGVALVRDHEPTVTTLDISLPDIDGFEVARQIRAFSDTYLIMLTARAEEIDTLLGLEVGADDYMTKPFRPRELRARIQAMLRRPRQMPVGVPGAAPAPGAPGRPADADAVTGTAVETTLTHRGLVIDTATRQVELDGEPVHLTPSEFALVVALLGGGGRVLSKTQLVRELWSEDYDDGVPVTESDKRTVEVHMANIRRKLRENPASPRFFETIRGVGYRRTAAG